MWEVPFFSFGGEIIHPNDYEYAPYPWHAKCICEAHHFHYTGRTELFRNPNCPIHQLRKK
jgi:hypothetical protein